MSSYIEQDTFFALAYRTGTDTWTQIPFSRRAHELGLYLPKGALVLDIGAGRGRVLFDFAKLGYRSIGVENNPDLVTRANTEIKAQGLQGDMRFIEGSALDIPLTDQSFDAAIDIGMMQHLKEEDIPKYISEVARVLKHDGLFFLVALSKRTRQYLRWHPSLDEKSHYTLDGVQYYFASDEELRALFEKEFEIAELEHDAPYGDNDATYTVLIMKKR